MALPAPGYLSNAERTNAEMNQALEDQRDFIAGIVGAVSTLTASAALTANQLGLVLIDATAGNLTVTLPESNAALGVRDVIVRRVDGGGNRLVVQATGTDRIKFHTHLNPAGYQFLVLMGAGDFWHLRSDGAGNWWPIARLDSDALGRPVFDTTMLFSPGGWGALAGATLQRAEWPWLWDHAQQSGMLTAESERAGMEGGWTSGDGAATFRGPEGRGEFLRILDEARGVDVGRAAGSYQGDAIRNIVGSITDMVRGSVTDTATGAFRTTVGATVVSSGAGGNRSELSFDASNVVPTANQNRPRSIAYPGRIKLI